MCPVPESKLVSEIGMYPISPPLQASTISAFFYSTVIFLIGASNPMCQWHLNFYKKSLWSQIAKFRVDGRKSNFTAFDCIELIPVPWLKVTQLNDHFSAYFFTFFKSKVRITVFVLNRKEIWSWIDEIFLAVIK